MAGGRPRTVCPEHDELIALGEEMLDWLTHHPEALHVSEWYSIEKFIVEKVWELMIGKPEFSGYYEKAKRIIGKKYLDKSSNVREGISQRWQRVYFKDLREEENETAKYNSDLRKEEAKKSDDAAAAHLQALMAQIQSLQSSRSSDSSNISTESKS